MKLEVEGAGTRKAARLARRILGRRCDLRVDANMAWNVERALEEMRELAGCGVRDFEQPVPKEDLDGLRRLVPESGLGIMVDESMDDRGSPRPTRS